MSFIVIGVFIVQNLFVLVLLGSLNQENIKSAREIFDDLFEGFKKHYFFILKENQKVELPTILVLRFFKTLDGPLGSNLFYLF